MFLERFSYFLIHQRRYENSLDGTNPQVVHPEHKSLEPDFGKFTIKFAEQFKSQNFTSRHHLTSS